MKTTKRLTAVALVLLLLLSLCSCKTEKPSPAEQGGTTTVPTQVTTTASSATTATATDTQTATTETTVVTTQVTTIAPTTAATTTTTTTTAAPTTTVPQKPAIEWTVIKGELPEDGITPGAAFPCGKAVLRQLGHIRNEAVVYGNIIDTVTAFNALDWGSQAEWTPPPVYEAAFFEENVLVEFVLDANVGTVFAVVKSATLDSGTLHLHLECLDLPDIMSSELFYPARVLVELSHENAALIENMVVYETYRIPASSEIPGLMS